MGGNSSIKDFNKKKEALALDRDLVKKQHSKGKLTAEERIKLWNKDIYWIDSKLAWGYSNYYWTRKNQIVGNKKALIKKRDAFLAQNPEDVETWIEINAAIQGVVIEPIQDAEIEVTVVEKAIAAVWSMDKAGARKTASILLSLAMELGIICMALIIGKRKESTDLKTSLNNALREYDVAV